MLEGALVSTPFLHEIKAGFEAILSERTILTKSIEIIQVHENVEEFRRLHHREHLNFLLYGIALHPDVKEDTS